MIGLVLAATIAISGIVSHAAAEMAVVYATIHNNGSSADVLDGVKSQLGDASLHRSIGAMHAGMETMSMQPVASIAVPAHGDVELAPGGYHIMIENLHDPVRTGQTIIVRLHFRHGGWVSARGTVTPY